MTLKDTIDGRSAGTIGALPVRQDRSERTRDAILAAAERALDAGDLENATVQEIARAAGISIGAFYGRFENKDAAMAALLNKMRTRDIDTLIEMTRSAGSIEDWATNVAEEVFQLTNRIRTLFLRAARGSGLPHAHREAATADNIRFAHVVAEEFARLAPSVPQEQRFDAARFAILQIGSMTRDWVLFSAGWMGDDASREWIKTNIARSIRAYLNSLG